jgi:hypothetical protein
MNIREISDVFKDTANQITAIKSYNFGWPSDRTRSSNTEDYQELNEFPRVFFSVPTITGSDQTRKQDTYQVTLLFDDLLGYNNEGDADLTLQIDKWAALQEYANYFVQRLNKVKQSILPNYLFIPEAPSITFDSFTGLQRMITVQLSFTLVVPTNCEPVVSKLVECIANIVTSSNLTAALKNIFELVSSLQASSSLSANLQLTKFAASSLNANASLNASALVSKLAASSLTGAGTLAADLTVGGATLLLDLYPDAAAAYSLRKLRTAYTGNAIRVRRSSDNTEQDIGFVSGNLDTVSLLAFCGVGNGFVTTWYDQSGNARNATQTTAANQPQIVSSGVVILTNTKPSVKYNGTSTKLIVPNSTSLFKFLHDGTTSTVIGVAKLLNSSIDNIHGTLISTSGFSSSSIGYQTGIENRIVVGSPNSLRTIVFRGIIDPSIENNTVTIGQNQNLYIDIVDADNDTASLRSSHFINNNNVNRTNTSLLLRSLSNSSNNLSIGSFESLSSPFITNGNIQEIIIYSTDQNTNLTGIQTNININYAIY